MGAPTAQTVGPRNAIPPARPHSHCQQAKGNTCFFLRGIHFPLGKPTSRQAAKSPVCWKAKQPMSGKICCCRCEQGCTHSPPKPPIPWQLGGISLGFLGSFPPGVMDSFLLDFSGSFSFKYHKGLCSEMLDGVNRWCLLSKQTSRPCQLPPALFPKCLPVSLPL